MSVRRPTLALDDLMLNVHELDVRHVLDLPAWAEVAVTLSEPPSVDQVRDWLGASVELCYNDQDMAIETWRITKIEATGRRLRIQLGGALSTLALSGGDAWRSNTCLLDCACAVLERHETGSLVSVSGSAATMALPLVIQPAIDDLTFLRHLGAAGGFLAVDTLDNEGVALIDEPMLGHATVSALAGVAPPRRFIATREAPASLAALLESDGARDSVVSGSGETPAAILPGVTLANQALQAQIEARARRGGPAVTHLVETLQAGARPGWRVDVAGLGGGLGVISVVRTLERNGRVRSTLSLTKGADFAAIVAPLPPPQPVPLQVARVVAADSERLPGYVTLAIDHPGGGEPARFPAQIAGQCSGTGNGTSILPLAGALVLVAFAGDGLMPRPFVLGVLRDRNHPPPQHAGKQANALVIANTATGTEVAIACGADGDTLTMSVGSGRASLTMRPDGSLSLVGGVIDIDANTLTLRGSAISLEEK